MKQIVQELVTYEAIDGEIFNSRDECLSYENGLPKHLRWCLANKVTADGLQKEGVWHVGYRRWTSYTTYDPPEFLRTGGDREESVSSSYTTGFVRGTFSDAVSWAVNQGRWFSEDNFITPINVIDLQKDPSE